MSWGEGGAEKGVGSQIGLAPGQLSLLKSLFSTSDSSQTHPWFLNI